MNLVKIAFTERDITAMLAELAAIRKHVNRLSMVRRIIASHRLDRMHHL